MAKQKRRPANDRAFKVYKSTNRRAKNKIRKLQRYVDKNPNDKQAAARLQSLKKVGLEPKIVSRGSGQTIQGKFQDHLAKCLQKQIDHMMQYNASHKEHPSNPQIKEQLIKLGVLPEPLSRKLQRRGYRKLS